MFEEIHPNATAQNHPASARRTLRRALSSNLMVNNGSMMVNNDESWDGYWDIY
jgi:hypothetical protein